MPSRPKPASVDEYVANLSPERREVANALRSLIRQTFPDVMESIDSWGGPTFSRGGKELAWMGNYASHTNLGLFVGDQIKSPLIEGTGKRMRHIKVRTVNDIDPPVFEQILRQAANL